MTTEPPNEVKIPRQDEYDKKKKKAGYWRRLFRALWEDLKAYVDKQLSK